MEFGKGKIWALVPDSGAYVAYAHKWLGFTEAMRVEYFGLNSGLDAVMQNGRCNALE